MAWRLARSLEKLRTQINKAYPNRSKASDGTNWAAAALSLVSSNGPGGRYIAETADTACTAGTSIAARIKTLNNKNVAIYGVALSAR